MNRYYHVPAHVAWSGEALSGERAARLERTVLAAVRRAVERAATEGTVVVTGDGPDDEPVREPFDAARFRPERDRYSTPAYDGGGTATELPVATAIDLGEDVIATSPDRVVEQPPRFERAAVVALAGNVYAFVRSRRHVTTPDVGRAHEWGRVLFGSGAWVIAAKAGPLGEVTYHVAALDKPITRAALAPRDPARPGPPAPAGPSPGRILRQLPGDYTVVAVGNESDVLAAPTPESSRWFTRGVGASRQAGMAAVDSPIARRAVFAPVDGLLARGRSDHLGPAAELLSTPSAPAFGILDQGTRAGYLEVLVDAWAQMPRGDAVVKLLMAMDSRSELDAALGLLRQRGILEHLCAQLDSRLWGLLVATGGKFGDPRPITFAFLLELLQDAGLVPRRLEELLTRIGEGPAGPVIGADLVAEVEAAARDFLHLLGGELDDIAILLRRPREPVERPDRLARMALMVQLAQWGHPPALERLGEVVTSMSQQVVMGLRGAELLGIGDHLVRRARWAVLCEAASWFVGVSEVEALVADGGAPTMTTAKASYPKAREERRAFTDCKEFARSLGETDEAGEADSQFDPKLTPTTPDPVKSDGGFTWTVKVTWSFSDRRSTTKVTRPYWDGMSKAEKAAVDEFVRRLKAHEDGHHDAARAYAATAGKELTGEGATIRDARRDLQEKLEQYKREVQDELDQARRDYDNKTDHGRNQAAVGGRNTTFVCPE